MIPLIRCQERQDWVGDGEDGPGGGVKYAEMLFRYLIFTNQRLFPIIQLRCIIFSDVTTWQL